MGKNMTVQVRFRFRNNDKIQTVSAQKGDLLTQVAHCHDIYIKQSCGNKANCGDCKVKISSDENSLSEMNIEEKQLLGNVYHITKERLACQARIISDCEVIVLAPQNTKE